MIKTNNMLTRLTFYNKKIHLTLFKNIHISKRSVHIASWNSLCHHQGTHVTLPLKVTISTRFMSKWKALSNMIKNAPKLFNALDTKAPEVAAVAKKVEEPKLLESTVNSDQNFKALKILQGSTLPVPLKFSPKSFSWPLLYNEPSISGISCLYPHERKKLDDDIIYSEKYFKVFAIELAQSLTYGFKEGKPTAESLYKAMSYIFPCAEEYISLLKDPEIQRILKDKILSLKQHVTVFVYQDKQFDIKELSQFLGNTIDFIYHKGITAGGIGEVYVARRTLHENILQKYFGGNIIAVDHESPNLDKGDPYKTIESNEQISQSYSDFLISFFNIREGGIERKNVYRDVKMYYGGPFAGYLSFIPFLELDVRVFKNLCNDYATQIQAKLSQRPLLEYVDMILEDAFNKIKTIQKTTTLAILPEQVKRLKTIMSELAFNPLLIRSHIHITLVDDLGINKDILLKKIVENIAKDINLRVMFDHKVVFPNKSKISEIAWVKMHKIILQSIEKHVPESVRDAVRINYMEHFKEFCTRHAIDYH